MIARFLVILATCAIPAASTSQELELKEELDSALARRDFESAILASDELIAREESALREGLASTTDPYVVALLAEADRTLGLLWESREGYCRARDLAPADPSLQKRCETLESLLRN